MDFQRDVFSEEAIMNIYTGIEQDIPEYIYHHSIYTEIVLKMMLEMRDIQNGYGQQEKSHRLLKRWISQCPPHFQQTAEDQAIHILEQMCIQYGCWRDIKQICVLLSDEDRYQHFVKRALQLMNDHLYIGQPNVAKWIPRGQFFYDYLATDYVERFMQIETAPIQQMRQIYKGVVKNNTPPRNTATTTHKQKTKRSIQEAETGLIQKALLLAQRRCPRPPEGCRQSMPQMGIFNGDIFSNDMNEEDELEQEWLDALENYESIDNAVLLLDTPVSFQTTPENMNRLKTICRFLYKISLPSRKRVFITTAPEPYWLNVLGKTLVETIQAIVQYTEINDNPTEKSRTTSIQYLLNSLKSCEIPVEEMEKMTWIFLSNFSQQTYWSVHGGMTNLFLSYSILPQHIPNMIYIKTPSSKDPPPQPFPLHPICRPSVSIRTFWTECFPDLGISNNHWNQIAKITKDPFIRQFTPFQNVVNVITINTTVL